VTRRILNWLRRINGALIPILLALLVILIVLGALFYDLRSGRGEAVRQLMEQQREIMQTQEAILERLEAGR
jgi:hypothetical protein